MEFQIPFFFDQFLEEFSGDQAKLSFVLEAITAPCASVNLFRVQIIVILRPMKVAELFHIIVRMGTLINSKETTKESSLCE